MGLDLFAYDFFGTAFVREGRTDAQWRQVIGRELLRPRATRAALQSALTDLTGRAPRIFEPAQPGDTGAYAARGGRPFALAYGAAGGWGSLRYPYQAFVVAFRPAESGIPGVSGWGQGAGGYGVGAIEYASLDMSAGQVTDGQIMAEITKNIPIACTAWTRLSN
ncbi:MAG TPA: hypothetical protein VFA03_06460 [Acetobacteraceae bacterium]|nr:hypothetical protein [Acetobacteraceae bacterium]